MPNVDICREPQAVRRPYATTSQCRRKQKSGAGQSAEKERRRQAAIEKVGTLTPKWKEAAAKFEKWLRAGDAALSALMQARANAIRHPVTGYPLQMGGHGSSHPALPPKFGQRGGRLRA